MDVLAKIKQLDEQRAKLLDEAKATALTNAEAAIADLNSLGFNYRLVEAKAGGIINTSPSTGGRRTGIRKDVLAVITEAGEDGITAAEVRTKIGIPEGDASGYGSVANVLSNLKKQEKITLKDSIYYAV